METVFYFTVSHRGSISFEEVRSSILDNVTSGSDHFILNCTHKNCNGVVPVKERCYEILEKNFGGIEKSLLHIFIKMRKKAAP